MCIRTNSLFSNKVIFAFLWNISLWLRFGFITDDDLDFRGLLRIHLCDCCIWSLGWEREREASQPVQTCTVLWSSLSCCVCLCVSVRVCLCVLRFPRVEGLHWDGLSSFPLIAMQRGPAAYSWLWRLKYLPLCLTGTSWLTGPPPLSLLFP